MQHRSSGDDPLLVSKAARYVGVSVPSAFLIVVAAQHLGAQSLGPRLGCAFRCLQYCRGAGRTADVGLHLLGFRTSCRRA